MVQDHSNFENIQINWPISKYDLVMILGFYQSERLFNVLAVLNRLSKVTVEFISTALFKTRG